MPTPSKPSIRPIVLASPNTIPGSARKGTNSLRLKEFFLQQFHQQPSIFCNSINLGLMAVGSALAGISLLSCDSWTLTAQNAVYAAFASLVSMVADYCLDYFTHVPAAKGPIMALNTDFFEKLDNQLEPVKLRLLSQTPQASLSSLEKALDKMRRPPSSAVTLTDWVLRFVTSTVVFCATAPALLKVSSICSVLLLSAVVIMTLRMLVSKDESNKTKAQQDLQIQQTSNAFAEAIIKASKQVFGANAGQQFIDLINKKLQDLSLQEKTEAINSLGSAFAKLGRAPSCVIPEYAVPTIPTLGMLMYASLNTSLTSFRYFIVLVATTMSIAHRWNRENHAHAVKEEAIAKLIIDAMTQAEKEMLQQQPEMRGFSTPVHPLPSADVARGGGAGLAVAADQIANASFLHLPFIAENNDSPSSSVPSARNQFSGDLNATGEGQPSFLFSPVPHPVPEQVRRNLSYVFDRAADDLVSPISSSSSSGPGASSSRQTAGEASAEEPLATGVAEAAGTSASAIIPTMLGATAPREHFTEATERKRSYSTSSSPRSAASPAFGIETGVDDEPAETGGIATAAEMRSAVAAPHALGAPPLPSNAPPPLPSTRMPAPPVAVSGPIERTADSEETKERLAAIMAQLATLRTQQESAARTGEARFAQQTADMERVINELTVAIQAMRASAEEQAARGEEAARVQNAKLAEVSQALALVRTVMAEEAERTRAELDAMRVSAAEQVTREAAAAKARAAELAEVRQALAVEQAARAEEAARLRAERAAEMEAQKQKRAAREAAEKARAAEQAEKAARLKENKKEFYNKLTWFGIGVGAGLIGATVWRLLSRGKGATPATSAVPARPVSLSSVPSLG